MPVSLVNAPYKHIYKHEEKNMTIGNSFFQNPAIYMQQYAAEQGISLEEAKDELMKKFEEPLQPMQPSGHSESKNTELPPCNIDSDTYVQQYADKKGISLEEAKDELRKNFEDSKPPFIPSSIKTLGNKNRTHNQIEEWQKLTELQNDLNYRLRSLWFSMRFDKNSGNLLLHKRLFG